MNLDVTVTKSFPAFSLRTSFTTEGRRIGIFGRSGSGKSTMVAMIAGLVTPDSGMIAVDGETLFDSSRKINLPPEKRGTAVVFQDPLLFPHLNVSGNLLYGYRRCRTEKRIAPGPVAEVLELEQLLDRQVESLSGGEKQRVALGRAVLSNPRLLLMDEPLSALDDSLRFQIIPYLNRVGREFDLPFLFISHSILEMRLMTDRVLHMEKGLLLDITTPEVLSRKRMHACPSGFMNLFQLSLEEMRGGMAVYRWKEADIPFMVAGEDPPQVGFFEVSSRDIILFLEHPKAISARNLLECRVRGVSRAGGRVAVELEVGAATLIAEIVSDAADDLGIAPGSVVHAAIKAASFRRLA